MKLKTLILATVAASALAFAAAPVQAESLRDVIAATRGLDYVRGSILRGDAVFTGSTDGTRNQPNPDAISSVTIQTRAESRSEPRAYSSAPVTGCPMVKVMFPQTELGMVYQSNVNADCVPYSLMPGSGFTPAEYRTDTTATPVADSVIPTVTTVTVSVGLDRHGFTIDRDEVTTDR